MNEFDRKSPKQLAREKKKKSLLTGIVICIVLIILLALMIIHYQRVDATTFKIFVDGTQMQYTPGFYINDANGNTYVRAKDIAGYIGWTYQNGEYGSYTEDTNSGYLQNDYEVASFVAGSTTLKKYIEITAQPTLAEDGKTEIQPYTSASENGNLETSTLDLPVISQDGQIYLPLNNLPDICDCRVNYDNPYRMYIEEQKYLITLAQTNAAQFGYKEISGTYENMRLLGYGLMCVSNGSLYGVVGIDNGADVIGLKYTDMVFAQNNKEFFVKTTSGDEESVGIIDINGKQIVQPKNYSNIQVLSDELGLYLVEKDEKYGVLNRDGEVIVHCEYDSIGIPEELMTDFDFSVEDNKYLLFNNTIVVEQDDKYGLYDIEGDQTLPTAFTGFGYLIDDDEDSVENAENMLTAEFDDLTLSDGTTRTVKAIVVKQTTNGTTKYGIYDAERQKLILQCNYDRVYSITTKGETEYYIEFQGQTAKLSEQLAAYPEIFN